MTKGRKENFMAKLTKKPNKIVLVAIGTVLAASLAFATKPMIFGSHGGEIKSAELVSRDVGEASIGVASLNGDLNQMNNATASEDLTAVTDSYLDKQEEFIPQVEHSTSEDSQKEEEDKEEEVKQEEEKEENTPEKAQNNKGGKTSSIVLGVIAITCTLGLAAVLSIAFSKAYKKSKAEK